MWTRRECDREREQEGAKCYDMSGFIMLLLVQVTESEVSQARRLQIQSKA